MPLVAAVDRPVRVQMWPDKSGSGVVHRPSCRLGASSDLNDHAA